MPRAEHPPVYVSEQQQALFEGSSSDQLVGDSVLPALAKGAAIADVDSQDHEARPRQSPARFLVEALVAAAATALYSSASRAW